MKIEIPDIPKDLNPNGWEVEVSTPGVRRSGVWPLVYTFGAWKAVGHRDDIDCFCARLIEPRYMFNGELKTESECREILERDYELSIGGSCKSCPFDNCVSTFHPLQCKRGTFWRKKQPVPKPPRPANLPEGHKAYPVVIDEDPKTNKGLCVKFDKCLWPVSHCGNGTIEDGMYLYGWCEDDACSYRPNAIGERYQAKWALFRNLEVTK